MSLLSSAAFLYSVISTANTHPVRPLLTQIPALASNTLIAQVYEPYFPSHPERNAYVSLLQKTDPRASDTLLKAALVRRAVADVHRVLRLREDKPALQNLLQKGSIGDELWNSLLNAEKEMEAEILEVVGEANSFVEGWGQAIFPTANEIIANEKMRSVFEHTVEVKTQLGVFND